MTAIAAAISSRGIACASDSMLTASLNGSHVVIEWEKSKIIKVERCKGCISYWGLAGQLNSLSRKNDTPDWLWNTYNWLFTKVGENRYTKLSDFSSWLRDELDTKLRLTSLKNEDKGIGIHILGHDYIQGYYIPELFLLSNFGYDNGRYIPGQPLGVARQTFHTVYKDANVSEHGREEYRLAVRKYLSMGNLIFYNNGDPQFFNPMAFSIQNAALLAQHRKVARELITTKDLVPFVREPITMISSLQRAFYKPNFRLVGGKVHCMTVEPSGKLMTVN